MDLETISSSRLAEAKTHLNQAYSYEQTQEYILTSRHKNMTKR